MDAETSVGADGERTKLESTGSISPPSAQSHSDPLRHRLHKLNNQGCEFVAQGKFEEAMAVFQGAREIDGNFAPLYHNLGQLWIAQGDVERAIAAYQRALELERDRPLTHYRLAKVFQRRGQHAEAVVYFENVLQLDPNHPAALSDCGFSLMELGKLTEASVKLHRAMAREGDWVEVYCQRMAHRVPQDDFDRTRVACAGLLRQLQQTPESDEVREYLGQTYRSLARVLFESGWFAQAGRSYRKALKVQPQAKVDGDLQRCQAEEKRLEALKRGTQPLEGGLPKGVYHKTRHWWATANLDARHYLRVSGGSERSIAGSPSPPNPSRAACEGVNCGTCWTKLSQQLGLTDLGEDIGAYGNGNPANMAEIDTFVATVPEGRVWMVPQTSWWQVCEAIAIITPDEYLLADVSREYPGQLPACQKGDPTRHRLFRQESLPPLERIDGTVAVIGGLSANIYFHWMVDVLPRLELVRRSGLNWEEIDYFLVNQCQQPFQRETLKRLGVPERKILEADRHPYLQADRLVVPSFSGNLGVPPSWVLTFLRQTFQGKKITTTPTPERIYISRNSARYRHLINEEAVLELLQTFGFVSVRPEELELDEQIYLFSQAKAIVATHGSGLTNLIFCQPGTQVVELVSPNYPRHYFASISQQLGLEHYVVSGETFSCNFLRRLMFPSPLTEDIKINPKSLQKLLKKILKNGIIHQDYGAFQVVAQSERNSANKMPVTVPNPNPVSQLQAQAESLLADRKFEEAIATCKNLLQLEPNCAPACKILGNSFLAKKQVEEAIRWYNRAVELQPDYVEAYANLGSVSAQQKQWKQALVYYQKAIALKPEFAVAHRNLAKVWQKLGKEEEAANCLYSAYELEPKAYKPEQHLNLGNTLFEQGQLSQAIDCYQRALQFNPKLFAAYQNLGEALTRSGRYQEASHYYRQLVKLGFSQPGSTSLLKADPTPPPTPQSPPTPPPVRETPVPDPMTQPGALVPTQSMLPVGETLREPLAEMPWVAFAAYEFLGQVLQGQYEVKLAAQNFHLASQQLQDALKHQEQLYERGACYRQTMKMLATGDRRLDRDTVAALRSLEVELPGESGGLRGWLSHWFGWLGNRKEAERALPPPPPGLEPTQQLQLGSMEEVAAEYVDMGDALLEYGESDRAIRCYHRALSADPNGVQTYRKLADALNRSGRSGEAAMYTRKAQELEPTALPEGRTVQEAQGGSPTPTPLPGTPLFNRPEPDIEPASPKTETKVTPLFSSPQNRKTNGTAKKQSLKQGDRVASYLKLGQLYLQQKHWPEAIEAYRQALEINPQLVEAYKGLGDLAVMQENWSEAETHYHQALEVDPKAWEIHNKLGDMFQSQGKLDEAIAAYRRASGLTHSA